MPTVHDVIIVGAGPCGLAVAARLREQTPSALYTDEEHRRYHWLAKHAARSSVKNGKNGQTKTASSQGLGSGAPSMLVLDSSSNSWMARWHRLFAALQIQHLRSPMFFHPHPQDRDALLAFAHAQGRNDELVEITGCVGKEISKHRRKKRAGCVRCGAARPTDIDERDRQDYFTPSTELFDDFCSSMLDHYGLREDLVVQETVTSLDFGQTAEAPDNLFTVQTDRAVHYARAVVMATGPGEAPSIPAAFPVMLPEGAVHAAHLLPSELLGKSLARSIRNREKTNVLVVGGGLTSAQISDALIRSGVTKVWQVVRNSLRIKPFDVDLQWMGKYRNKEKAAFWMADDDEERTCLLRQAVGGGSVTPRYYKLLRRHIQSGRLRLYTNTVIASQSKCQETGRWAIESDPPISTLPAIDFVYFATGMQGGIVNHPALKAFSQKFPVDTVGGLPALTDDLMWRVSVPLFLTGKLASLRLGPGAGNLEGARMGAERIALAMEASNLGQTNDGTEGLRHEDSDDVRTALRYASGLGSRYEALEFYT